MKDVSERSVVLNELTAKDCFCSVMGSESWASWMNNYFTTDKPNILDNSNVIPCCIKSVVTQAKGKEDFVSPAV